MSIYNKGPWPMKPKEMEGYIPVTFLNRKEGVIMGRTLYIIEKAGPLVTYQGHITIRPRLVKGRVEISNHPHIKKYTVWIQEDESPADYKEGFDILITKFINEGKLYINLKDKITKYTKL